MKIARPKTEKYHNYDEGDCGKPIKDLKIISDDIEYSNLILNKITYSRVDSSLQKYDDFYKIILT